MSATAQGVESQSQQRLLQVKELWDRSQKDQLEIGRLLYEEREERLGVGGRSTRDGARCGKNLTAGWVTGRNQKYPRYWCWTKGCRAVGVRAERLEGSFRTLIGSIQPEAHLLASLPTLAARSWEQRKERIATDAKQLSRRLQDQTTLNERTIKAKLMGELSEDDFKVMKASTTAETQRIEAQIAALDAESSSMTALMKQTDETVINFRKSWESAVPTRRREIQTALFPEGLAYDPESFLFCPQNASLMTFLSDILQSMGISETDAKNFGVPDGI
jgi:hypothetical protein